MPQGKPPAFQFYASDFLSDEKVSAMTMEERGVYITLLCHQWIEGSIPADEEAVRKLLRVADGYPLGTVMGCFGVPTWDPSRLVQKRLDFERQKQLNYRQKAAEFAAKGWEEDTLHKPKGTHKGTQRRPNALRLQSSSSSKPPFIPPTEADAMGYFTEKGVNGDHWRVFMNYYLEKDWKDVKDWRRRADTWIIRGRSRGEIPEARGKAARVYVDEEGNPL